MNKTQDKFSLPAVTLSIFAAAAERLPVCSSSRALLGRRCWLQYC